MTEIIYNQLHLVFNGFLGLNATREDFNSLNVMGDFIIFLNENKDKLNITEQNIKDYHNCYSFLNNVNIRDIIDKNSIAFANSPEDEIIRLYNIYDKIFEYFLNLKPYEDALYDFRLLAFIYKFEETSFSKYILLKEHSNKDNTIDRINIIKLLRKKDNILRSFINLEKAKNTQLTEKGGNDG